MGRILSDDIEFKIGETESAHQPESESAFGKTNKQATEIINKSKYIP